MDLKQISIEDIDLVFFDVETTGLSPQDGDSICEMGGLKVRGNDIISSFHTLIHPKRSIPEEIRAIHGISDDDVKDAPYFEQAVDNFLYFLGTSVICGYNVGFDLGFLNWELKKINYSPIEVPSVDILMMARRLFKNLESYKLTFIAQHLGIQPTRFHRAQEDANTAKEIFFKIRDTLKNKGITRAQDFITLYGFSNDFLKKNQQPKLSIIKKSILAQLLLQIDYVSFNNNLRTYIVMPKELIEDRKTTYLLAENPKTKDTITFNIHRILQVEVV